MNQNKIHTKNIVTAGAKIVDAKKALIMVHGRGGTAEDILSVAAFLKVDDFALLAPQANNNSWYPYSFIASLSHNEPWLSSALSLLEETMNVAMQAGISEENIYFLGFSQGACLTLEFVTRNAKKYGGIAAFSGGLIGDKIYRQHYNGDFRNTPFFIGSSNPDPHIPVERVDSTSTLLEEMHADVTKKIYPDMGHTISNDEIEMANKIIFSQTATS